MAWEELNELNPTLERVDTPQSYQPSTQPIGMQWEDIPTSPNQVIPTASKSDKTLTEQVVDNTTNLLKYQGASFANVINAGIGNMNEVIGVDSTAFRENQAYWREVATSNEKQIDAAYGDGFYGTVAKEIANPLNYALVTSLGRIGAVVGTDVATRQSLEGDVEGNTVAIGASAGIIAGKFIPIVFKTLGDAGRNFLNDVRTLGLPEPMRIALRDGNDEALEKLIRQFEVSKSMKMGDLPFGGSNSTTRNTFEARRAASESGPLAIAQRKAVGTVKRVLATGDSSEVTASQLYDAVHVKGKVLKAPMTEAYNNSLHSASTKKEFDMTEIHQSIIDELRDTGNYDPATNFVMKDLYRREYTKWTPHEKAQQKVMDNITAEMDKLQYKLDTTDFTQTHNFDKSNTQARWKSLAKRRDEIKDSLPTDSPLYSEKEIILAVKGISHKLSNKGGTIDQSGEATLMLQKARQALSKAAGELFEGTGSKIFKEYDRATGLANKYYDYAHAMPEISELLLNGKAIPEDIMMNLLKNPARMKHLIDYVGDSEIGPKLARQAVAQMGRARTIPQAGALDKLDMKQTSQTLDNIFSVKANDDFFRKYLPETQYNDLVALKDVTASFNKMAEALPDAVAGMEYIKGADGVVNTSGRFIKTIWDMGGVIKNDLIQAAGTSPTGMMASTRIKPNTDLINQATVIIKQRLGKPRVRAMNAWAGTPALNDKESNIVNRAIEHMEAVMKTYMPRGGQ